MTTDYPSVPKLPAEVAMTSPWDREGYRQLYGDDRTVTDHAARVYALGVQAWNGIIDGLVVYVADGENPAMEPLNSVQARELAVALLETAAELDRWARA